MGECRASGGSGQRSGFLSRNSSSFPLKREEKRD